MMMAKSLVIFLAVVCLSGISHAQQSDTVFHLQIGDTSCRFARVERRDTVQIEVQAGSKSTGVYDRTVIDPIHVVAIRQHVRDTVIREITFVLLDTIAAPVIQHAEADTVVPVPVLEPMNGHYTRVRFDQLDYAVRAEMSYDQFINMVSHGLELKSGNQTFHVAIDGVEYMCGGKEGLADLSEDFRTKLDCLQSGGDALIDIGSSDDHVYIHHPKAELVRIHIRN